MSSPITFSGFNQIDFSQILTLVMQQERVPLVALENRKTTLETQSTTFGTLLAKITALETAVTDLGSKDSLASVTASSSDAGVGVSTTAGTVEGTYDVVVSQLARAQVAASSSTYTSVDQQIATGGTLTLLASNKPPQEAVTIAVTGPMTLRQLADAINEKSDSPVIASVVQSAPGSYRLVLTGRSTGTDNAYTMTSALTGGDGVTFPPVNTQEARNAVLTVNSLSITSATNTVESVIPGVTLRLSREDATTSATVTVKRDTTEVVKTIEKFTAAYNDVVTFFKDQSLAAVAGKANIGRDPILRSLRESLRKALTAAYPQSVGDGQLASVGLEFDALGKLKVNKKKLEAGLQVSQSDVQRLFSGTDGKGGAFGALKTMLGDYSKSGGIVATVRQNLGKQATTISKRLDTMEMQLSVRRNTLQQEYIAADMAMTQMKAQSSSLSALGSQYRLF